MSAYAALRHYGICIPSVVANINPLALELFSLWSALDGTSRLATPQQWYDLPAIYVEACGVIKMKFAELKALRKRADDGA